MLTKLKSLKNHQGFMKYFKNTSWLFFEQIIRMTVALFVGILVTRYLGPEKYGIFSYAQSFVGLFSIIATLGLDNIVIRELVKKQYATNDLLGTVFVLKLFGSFIVLIILAIAIQFTSNSYDTNIFIFIIGAATIFQTFNVFNFYFQSKVESKYVVYAKMIALSISSILKILFILTNEPLIYFVYIVLFESFIVGMGLLYFFIKKSAINIFIFTFQKEIALTLLKDSWPLIFSGMVVAIYMKIDQIMIKELMDAKSVGIYAVAARLSELWYFIPAAIVSSLFPAIIKYHENDKIKFYKKLQQLYDLMVWMAIAIAIVISFFGTDLVQILFGKAYIESGNILIIHIWSGVFVFLGFASGKYFIVKNLAKKSFYKSLLGAIINVILNYIWIKQYGIIGAAMATLAAQIFSNYIYDFLDKDLRGQFIMKTKSFFPVHLIKREKFVNEL